MTDLPEHVRSNRAFWDELAAEYEADGLRKWEAEEPLWGIWEVPEAELGVLPDDLDGVEAVELGCGTAYVSAWLARRGARPIGVDNSEAQLATARRLQERFGLEFPLFHGNAEETPFEDGSFDLVVSEYGAILWCDPYRWIPEAARLLRPGGRLLFYTNSPLVIACDPDEGEETPAGERLHRPLFGMHRVTWSDGDPSIEFHLPHGEMVKLLGECGLVVEDLTEVRPPLGSTTRYQHVTLEWARRWPSEEIWKARKPDR